MLLQWFRVWRYNGSVFTDLSLDNQDDTAVLPVDLDTTDYLYMSSTYPFNNFFAWMDTPNTAPAKMKVEYWGGTLNGWKTAAEVLDGTKGFTKSGVAQYFPDDDYSWHQVGDSNETPAPQEIIDGGLRVYGQYYMRVSFDADLDSGTTVKKIGYAFTLSQELPKYDIEIDRFLESFATGKTDWIQEIMTASEMLVKDLKAQDFIAQRGQILLLEDVAMATAYKTLELIYYSLGAAYDQKRAIVANKYEKLLNQRYFSLDLDMDGELDEGEVGFTTRVMQR